MEIIFAGFGGQGVLTSGLITAYMAMKNGLETIWSPAYGGQMRGGKAFSLVKFDKEPIAEPVVTELDVLVAMNQPSLDFCSDLKEGGLLIVNSDSVEKDAVDENKYKVVWLPVNDLAQQAGSVQSANIVSIGALIKLTGAFDINEAEQILCQFFEDKGKGKFNKFNVAALRAGYDAV
ncbi:MAG: 2-oxoacid:acceptor oxidoreductase family protein [Lachnospiraceae bacterium]|nr:2-oxoacid:acceptor oxidoreductase family protein [Lachnospiraceae bacterium]MBR3003591.1 2-oxoacid:acceptor oxidoreductase family protein [Lachnospiraceae bacterium]MBR6348912.1 2-oxoacid:acceptor oxidoreductase family protein [Lachnospiraceae bacterium]